MAPKKVTESNAAKDGQPEHTEATSTEHGENVDVVSPGTKKKKGAKRPKGKQALPTPELYKRVASLSAHKPALKRSKEQKRLEKAERIALRKSKRANKKARGRRSVLVRRRGNSAGSPSERGGSSSQGSAPRCSGPISRSWIRAAPGSHAAPATPAHRHQDANYGPGRGTAPYSAGL